METLLAGISSVVSGIADPCDYFSGTIGAAVPLPKNLLVFHRPSTKSMGPGRSHHHRYVLIVNLRGEAGVIVDGVTIFFRAGQALMVFPYQFHHFFSPQPRDLSWLFVTFELHESELIAGLRYSPVTLTPLAASLVEEIAKLYTSERRTAVSRAALLQLATARLLLELADATVGIVTEGGVPEAKRSGLAAAINRHIFENLAGVRSLATLAARFSLSESRLRHIFRDQTGMSLGWYVRELRMRRAQQLVRTTQLNISEAAYACGYDTVHSFSRAFKARWGVSPRAYRRTGRGA